MALRTFLNDVQERLLRDQRLIVEDSGAEQAAEHSFRVAAEEAGLRLDRLLAGRYAVLNRAGWQARIKAGRVLLNDRPVRPGRRVQQGDLIWFGFQRQPEPPINRQYRIVSGAGFEDAFYAVDKPPDLPVHAAGVYYKHTLLELLRQDFQGRAPLYPVHRLDRETSGLLLLACNGIAARELQQLFQKNLITKEYLVLVEGQFPAYLDAVGRLGPHPASAVRKKQHFVAEAEFHKSGLREEKQQHRSADRSSEFKPCRTEFWCAQLLEHNGTLSLVKVLLHSGRMHQIRATLCSLGFPVVGDRLYGVDDQLYLKFIQGQESEADLKKLRLPRTALHCHRLRFEYPAGKLQDLQSPMPSDMQALVAASTQL